jgi:hypothetical protein
MQKKSEDLNERIPLKVFPVKDEVKILDINNYKNFLELINHFLI